MIWPTLLPVAQCVLGTPWFQVSSRKCLVLRGIYHFPLALPLDQKENWDSPYSHVNAQNKGEGVRGRGKTEKWDSPLVTEGHYWKVWLFTECCIKAYWMQSWLEGRIWVGKGAQATGMTTGLRIQSSKADSNTCESFTRSGLKLESVHQESPCSDVFRKRATKPLLNQRQRQKRLTWAVEKKNSVVQSPLFRWK